MAPQYLGQYGALGADAADYLEVIEPNDYDLEVGDRQYVLLFFGSEDFETNASLGSVTQRWHCVEPDFEDAFAFVAAWEASDGHGHTAHYELFERLLDGTNSGRALVPGFIDYWLYRFEPISSPTHDCTPAATFSVSMFFRDVAEDAATGIDGDEDTAGAPGTLTNVVPLRANSVADRIAFWTMASEMGEGTWALPAGVSSIYSYDPYNPPGDYPINVSGWRCKVGFEFTTAGDLPSRSPTITTTTENPNGQSFRVLAAAQEAPEFQSQTSVDLEEPAGAADGDMIVIGMVAARTDWEVNPEHSEVEPRWEVTSADGFVPIAWEPSNRVRTNVHVEVHYGIRDGAPDDGVYTFEAIDPDEHATADTTHFFIHRIPGPIATDEEPDYVDQDVEYDEDGDARNLIVRLRENEIEDKVAFYVAYSMMGVGPTPDVGLPITTPAGVTELEDVELAPEGVVPGGSLPLAVIHVVLGYEMTPAGDLPQRTFVAENTNEGKRTKASLTRFILAPEPDEEIEPEPDELPPPPPRPAITTDRGMQHTFISPDGLTTHSILIDPDTPNELPIRRIACDPIQLDIAGGSSAVSGVITVEEFEANPAVFVVGATWLIKDLNNDDYVFGGNLRDPLPTLTAVGLVADGWGTRAERNVERFLVQTRDLTVWTDGSADPEDDEGISYPPDPRIQVGIKQWIVRWDVQRHTAFVRNAAGLPTEWASGIYQWFPKTPIKWIRFTFDTSGINTNYEIQIVGRATGFSGPLTVYKRRVINTGQPTPMEFRFPNPGVELVGVRLVRKNPVRSASPFVLKINSLRVNHLLPGTRTPNTSDPRFNGLGDQWDIGDTFHEVFKRLNCVTADVESSDYRVVPFDAPKSSLAQVADATSVLDTWYWGLYPNANGEKHGEAGPVGRKVWRVDQVHAPVDLVPQERFNKVAYEYDYGGGYLATEEVAASPNPFPNDYDSVFDLSVEDPGPQNIIEPFAQAIADILSELTQTGRATITRVTDPDTEIEYRPGVVKPGHYLSLTNYIDPRTDNPVLVTVGKMSLSPNGVLAEVEFTSGYPIADELLAERQLLFNRFHGRGFLATRRTLENYEPKAPENLTVEPVAAAGRAWLKVTWDQVTESTNDEGVAVSSYVARARPLRPGSPPEPVPVTEGGGWRVVLLTSDAEKAPPRTALIPAESEADWTWDVEVQAVDNDGQQSAWAEAEGVEAPGPTTASASLLGAPEDIPHTDDPAGPIVTVFTGSSTLVIEPAAPYFDTLGVYTEVGGGQGFITIPVDGVYAISATVNWEANPDGTRRAFFNFFYTPNSGLPPETIDVRGPAPSGYCVQVLARTLFLPAGTEVTLLAGQSSGGDLEVRTQIDIVRLA